MKKIFVLHWSALQESSLSVIHECYLAAFAAIGRDRSTTWVLEDTAERIGLPPEVTWSSEGLWHGRAAEAKEAFYAKFKEFSTLPLRKGAKEMMLKLAEEGQKFCIVSMKTRELMLKEIGRLGVAALAQAYFAPAEGEIPLKEELLLKAEDFFGFDNEFVFVGDACYKEAVEGLRWCFVEASEEVFATIK